METKTLPTILFAVIVACLLFTANSARSSFAVEGEDDGERYTGALRWKPKGEEQTAANSKFRIEMCVKDYCGRTWTKCYCCTLLPGEPCYLDQQKCWNVCPNKPAALEIAPSSAPVDKQQQLPS
ncbi:hypothetical protein QOZ80_2BG0159400 [Eleusine coracana subsp. coracana]|nr:hypothetical protein QOZ80_2BG0159400 [Eleusine coracana subsp. coracana]